jgi:hypothetical protein
MLHSTCSPPKYLITEEQASSEHDTTTAVDAMRESAIDDALTDQSIDGNIINYGDSQERGR